MNKKRILGYYIWLVVAAGALALVYCVARLPASQLDMKFALLAVLTIFFSARFAISIPNYSGQDRKSVV